MAETNNTQPTRVYQTRDRVYVPEVLVYAEWSPDLGQYLYPAGCRTRTPPTTGPNQAAVSLGDSLDDDWEVVSDYRGVTYWLPDRSRHIITKLGEEPPAGFLTADPGPSLEELKQAKSEDIARLCAQSIVSGFECSALGEVHVYPCALTDQANLQACILYAIVNDAPGFVVRFMCSDGMVWERREHTSAQIKQVGVAAKTHVEASLDRKDQLIAEVLQATTVSELDLVVW